MKPKMIYEPGTMECRVYIDCKDQLLKMISQLEKTEHWNISTKLKDIYAELDYCHEKLREKAS